MKPNFINILYFNYIYIYIYIYIKNKYFYNKNRLKINRLIVKRLFDLNLDSQSSYALF